ncbi:MAG: hypothetical protein WCR08_12020 [Gammaproteobacteria bacterium]|jgi:hypothetical protein
MAIRKSIRIKGLSGFSWAIISVFICSSFAMQYHTNDNYYEFFNILPLILAAVYWCEKSAHLINSPEYKLKKESLFNRDLLILSVSFLLGCLISLCLAYNNSDAKGWWFFIIYFMTLYGLIFSFLFSIVALLIKNHKIYTFIFSFIILGVISLGNFLPHDITLPLIGSTETLYVITCSLLVAHCLFAIICKITRVFLNRESNDPHHNKLT